MPQIITKERFKLISEPLHMSIKDSDLERHYADMVQKEENAKSDEEEDEEVEEEDNVQELIKINEKDPRNKI